MRIRDNYPVRPLHKYDLCLAYVTQSDRTMATIQEPNSQIEASKIKKKRKTPQIYVFSRTNK